MAGAILSITLNPLLYRAIPAIDGFVERHRWLSRLLNFRAKRGADDMPATLEPVHRAVVVGYGPIGKMVVRLLTERSIEPTVIEMNIETARRLRSQGIRAIYGDAKQHEVLQQAGISGAMSLILSSSGSAAAVEAIRTARQQNPDILVIARSDFLEETEVMRKAGADEVFSGEGEVALAITDSILRHLGSTPAQLDETREWIRTHLFAGNAGNSNPSSRNGS